jgi:hypothetical protein
MPAFEEWTALKKDLNELVAKVDNYLSGFGAIPDLV